MLDFFVHVFDTSDFPARWHCGNWSPGHGWLHILSDLGVWSAYVAIPCVLGYFVLQRKDIPFRGIFILFGAFILACGTTHLMEAIIFWWPAYRLAALIKLFTAIVSWGTVLALIPVVPKVLAMRSPEELEREITARRQAEASLSQANDELERRVEERTTELTQAVAALRVEREFLRTTLVSIGDAVITTDTEGRITNLNGLAESLTGWNSADAVGQPLDQVFHIVQEGTREPVENPVTRALAEGVVVGLANHTLLIARDGSERPIEDSAAPIRQSQEQVFGCVLVFRDVTERRQQQRELENREQQFRTLAESIPQLAWMANPDGHIFWYNRRWYDYTGKTFEEMEGWGWQSVHDPEELPQVLERWRASLSTGEPFDMVFPLKGADGLFRSFLTQVVPVRDDAGHIVRWFGTNTDVTAAKQTEETLREGRERLDFALAVADLGQWDLDLSNGTAQRTPRHDQIFGYPELLPRWTYAMFLDHVLPEDRDAVTSQFQDAIARGTTLNLECRILRADGITRWIWTKARIQRGNQGRVERMLGLLADITERKQTEAEIRDARSRLESTLEAAEIGTCVYDVVNDTVWADANFARMFGVTPADAAGGSLAIYQKIIHPDDWGKLAEIIDRTLASGTTYENEHRLVRADGGIRWVVARGRVERDPSGKPLRLPGVIVDITGQRLAEERERLLLAESVAANAKFRAFFEQGTVFASIINVDGTILDSNRLSWEGCGYKREQVVGKRFSEGPWWSSRTGLAEQIAVATAQAAAGQMFRAELPYFLADGRERLIDLTILPIKDDQGTVLFLAPSGIDITERRLAEAEIRQSEQRTRMVLESISDAFFAVDGEWKFTYVNPQAELILDRKPGELLGQVIWEVFPGLEGSELEQAYRRVAAERVTVSLAAFFPEQGRWYEVRVYPASDGISIYFQNVTERKRAEAEVARITLASERQRRIYETALSNTLDHHYILDTQGRFSYLNKALLSLWNWELSEAIGKNFFELGLSPPVAERMQSQIQTVIETRQPLTGETAFPNTAGDRQYEYIFVPVFGSSGAVEAVAGSTRDITERKRAEDTLREAERRWRTLAEAVPNLVWTALPNSQCDYMSSQWSAYTGIAEKELLGSNWLERVIHPDDRTRTLESWQLACADQADYDLEYRIRRHDGEYHWFKTRGVPLRDEQGKIVNWFGTCTDIEDQKQAVERLRESEERFRQLADAMPQIVWTTRHDGEIDYLNRQWREYTNLPDTMGNAGWDLIVHPDDMPASRERWAASIQTGLPFEMELRLLDRRQQNYRWHLIRTLGVRDGAGRLSRWYGTATDIHLQKHAEESSRYLAEASAALAAVVDYESTLQKVARLAVPYFADWSAVDVPNDEGGLRRLAVAHQDTNKIRLVYELMQKYPPDPQSPDGILTVYRTGQPMIHSEITDEMLVKGARGEEHLRLIRMLQLRSYISVPLTAAGKTHGVLTFATAESRRQYTDADLVLAKDLAHRAAVAIENTQLYQALREADQRKDEFLATLAHELRNPLAPIRNSLQILKMSGIDAATIERSREMMERQLHQLVRLVDDLLDVSRVMRGKIELRRERVELSRVIANAVETVQPLLEAQEHELTLHLPAESLPLDADPVRLAQVVGNLLTNAAKYTEKNGRIRLIVHQEGDWAVLRIQDNGIGIAAEMLPEIFELFVQVDHAARRSQGGLGIGLTLVKNLVEMHGGTVEAHSKGLGLGSEFVVRLPIAAQLIANTYPRENGENARRQKSSGRRLMVVDDNQDAAESLAMLLDLQGHEIRVANDGPAALELAKGYLPELVFLDIGMPGMDGYEVARRLRRVPGLEKVRLAALTGWGQQEDRRRTSEAGFDHHLVKPVEPNALEGVLANLR